MTNDRQPAGWSLRKKLLLSFGCATLLLFTLAQGFIVFGVPHTAFKGLLASQVQEAMADLSSQADSRKNQLERWLFERRGDLEANAENPFLQEAARAILHKPPAVSEAAAEEIRTRLRNYLHRFLDTYFGEYSKVEIVEAETGKVLVSTEAEEEGRDASHTSYFGKAINPAVEEVVVKEVVAGGTGLELVFARPIHDPVAENPAAIHAILVLHALDSSTISSLQGGIGRSGECVLVDQDSRLLAPLRYPLADGTAAVPLVYLDPAKPATMAAQGVETVVEAEDYRGVTVLAATRHLRVTSEMAWGLVVKIDKSEVYRPIRQTLVAHALVLSGALMLGGVLVLLIATRLTTPLAALSRAAAEIAGGDLGVRAVPAGSREFQALALSFNSMVARLENWHKTLAAAVEKRTSELTVANRALLESETRYRRIVETSGEGIWLGDENYHTTFVNPRLAGMVGYSAEELLGRHVSLLVTEEEDAHHRKQMDLRRSGQSARYERRLKCRDGSLLWTMVAATPILDEQGRFKGSLAMVTDISEQKRMAGALLENQARLDLALRSAGMGVFVTTLATQNRALDEQACRLFGLEPQSFGGTVEEIFQVVHPDDRQLIRAALARTLEEDIPYETEYRVVWPDGSVHHLAARGRLGRDESGQPERIVGVIWDVTANRAAEEERKRLQEQLNQAQKIESIGTLAGGIAHDFNNILAAIFGYADLAREDAPPGSHFENDIEKILIAAHRAKDLVKQILDFSRQTAVDRIPMRVQPLIKESLKLLRASIPATIAIAEEIDPRGGVIVADPTQVHQIVMNLCTNAYQAMEKRGGVLTVRLTMTAIATDDPPGGRGLTAGEYLLLTVADTGPGIGPAVIGRIFDPYFTTKEFGKGTGMGLAITHGIVKSYGGAITVESRVGEGTTFQVYFPVVAAGEVEAEPVAHHLPRGRERILFVDDEKIIVEIGETILERLGYTLTACGSGPEAWTLFQKQPDQFDLIITDQTMPGLTGSELASRILSLRPELPIILCTGYSGLIDESSALALGIKAFAQKPLERRTLARLVRSVLDGGGEPPGVQV